MNGWREWKKDGENVTGQNSGLNIMHHWIHSVDCLGEIFFAIEKMTRGWH